jgi:thiamine-phosphate pyrophosphorylase
VLEAGARRVVVVRALTEAADPFEAARRLKERLLAAAG